MTIIIIAIKSIEGVFMDQTISTVSSIAGDARKLYSVTSLFSLFVSLLICLHYQRVGRLSM